MSAAGLPEATRTPTNPVDDLMKVKRILGATQGEWTLPGSDALFFDQVRWSPKGGCVVLGTEARSSDKRFLLRLGEDGAPIWSAHFTRGVSLTESDFAIGEDGTIAILAQHASGLAFEGRMLVPESADGTVVSLLLLSDTGELKKCVSHQLKFSRLTRRIVFQHGFVTSSLDLFDPFRLDQPTSEGLVVIDGDGSEVRREVTGFGFEPRLLSSGSALAVIGRQDGAFSVRGRTIVPASPKAQGAWIVASFDPDLTVLWAHPFMDPRFHEATALSQDERGHVFAAFRYGSSHGFADDAFSGVVYELDDHGREVHHFEYGIDVTVTGLFPATNGLTVLGLSWQSEVKFKGTPLVWPLGDSSHDDYPDLLLRVDPEGKPLGQREYREPSANVSMGMHQTTITDVAAAGPTFLVTVGRITRGAPFAGLRVAKGEPELSYVARIRRP